MDQKKLIIICITAILCVSILSVTAVILTKNNATTNNTTNNTTNSTVNVTLNDSNTTNNTTTVKTKKSSTTTKSKQKEEDQVTADGWNPKEHEVNRENLGDGMQRVEYDDGYHRVVDKNGKVLSYGY